MKSIREYIIYLYKEELKDTLYYIIYQDSTDEYKIKIVKDGFINKDITVSKEIVDFYYENRRAIIREEKLKTLGI
jgi:hypothetical protein